MKGEPAHTASAHGIEHFNPRHFSLIYNSKRVRSPLCDNMTSEEIGPWEVPQSPLTTRLRKFQPKVIVRRIPRAANPQSHSKQHPSKPTPRHVPLKAIYLMEGFRPPPELVRIETVRKSRLRSPVRAVRKLSLPQITDSPQVSSRPGLTPLPDRTNFQSPMHVRAESEAPRPSRTEFVYERCVPQHWSKVLAGRPLAPLKQQSASLGTAISALERRLTRLLASSRRRGNLSVS